MHSILAASSSDYRHWWYKHYLSRNGFAVRNAASALECFALLRKETPDVLILETPLPWGGADGILDVLSSEPALKRLRVLLVVVQPDAGEVYRVSRYEVDDVLFRVELESRLLDHLHCLLSSGRVRSMSVSA